MVSKYIHSILYFESLHSYEDAGLMWIFRMCVSMRITHCCVIAIFWQTSLGGNPTQTPRPGEIECVCVCQREEEYTEANQCQKKVFF